MILHEHEIEGVHTPVTICPIGDIQWAGDRSEIAFDHLREHIANCLRHPNPLFIGMGDYVDFASPSNRAAFYAANFYDQTKDNIKSRALELTEEVYEQVLKPTKGKWLGMLPGHHFFPLKTGGTTDTKLCELLDAPFLGDPYNPDVSMAVVRVNFRRSTEKHSVTLWAWHGAGYGAGYGQKAAYPSYKLENIANYWEGIDVFLMGHFTKKSHASFDRPYPMFNGGRGRTQPYLKHRTIHLIGTGGWSKGYIEGSPDRPARATYVEKRGLSPVALGAPVVRVRPKTRTSTRMGSEVWEPGITVEL